MAKAKSGREKKQRWGQFMTPPELSQKIVDDLDLHEESLILEPSFGNGSFIVALIEKLVSLGSGDEASRFHRVMTRQIVGVEIDSELFESTVTKLQSRWGTLPSNHRLFNTDFFRIEFPLEKFDNIVGNPPFGGSFDPEIEDILDRRFGKWEGHKLKKETYSFFIAKSLDLLQDDGVLSFISSDSFLTINTMSGLRRRLMGESSITIEHVKKFSEETTQPTVLLTAVKSGESKRILVDGEFIDKEAISLTENFSWRINADLSRYFLGETLGSYIVCTGGMTIGKNELFVRKIQDGYFEEPFDFVFFDEPVTLTRELEKARLNRLSPRIIERIRAQEEKGETTRNVAVRPKEQPVTLTFPHPDYLPYNKASSHIVYSQPEYVVFWKDDGDAVLTFKKNGKWYLHGVGGRRFFQREGLTWQLVSQRIRMRYLPSGYILDSGAPCAFLRDGIDHDELYFILAWCQTTEASRILKEVINHTRNIQGKDIERLPYPWWVGVRRKGVIIRLIKHLLSEAVSGRKIDSKDSEIMELERLFRMD